MTTQLYDILFVFNKCSLKNHSFSYIHGIVQIKLKNDLPIALDLKKILQVYPLFPNGLSLQFLLPPCHRKMPISLTLLRMNKIILYFLPPLLRVLILMCNSNADSIHCKIRAP